MRNRRSLTFKKCVMSKLDPLCSAAIREEDGEGGVVVAVAVAVHNAAEGSESGASEESSQCNSDDLGKKFPKTLSDSFSKPSIT